MGDDNKIKDLVAQASRESLAKSLQNQQKESLNYDLEQEFAATKKHRSFFVVGLTLVTMIALVFSAWLAVRIIERRSSQHQVDISSFEDLNLKDLLNVAKRTEDELALAQRELIALERQREDEIRVVQSASTAELELINAQRSSETEKSRARAVALQRRDNQNAEITVRYEPLIMAKLQQIDEISRRLAQYDSRMLEQAKANEEMLASERRLFEMGKQNLIETYDERIGLLEKQLQEENERFEKSRTELVATLRATHQAELHDRSLLYNPVFSDPVLLDILEQPAADTSAFRRLFDHSDGESGMALPEAIIQAGSDSASAERVSAIIGLAETAANQAATLEALGAALADVPYFNSVPVAHKRLQDAAYGLASAYSSIAELLASELLQIRQAYQNLETHSQATIRTLEAERQRLMANLTERQNNLQNVETENSIYQSALDVLAIRSGDAGFVLEVRGREYVIWLRPLAGFNRPGRAWIVRNERSLASISVEPDGDLYRGQLLELTGEEVPDIFDSVVLQLDSATEGE